MPKRTRGQRLAEFLQKHPRCYFCGETATTKDHVPHSDYFKDREWPEGYEFPACQSCNNPVGKVEQAVKLYFRISDISQEAEEGEINKLMMGVNNNTPELLPRDMRAIEKRRELKKYGFPLPQGEFLSDYPMIAFPKQGANAFRIFSRRLACALYYKHVGKILPHEHFIRTYQIQSVHEAAGRLVNEIGSMMQHTPAIRRGKNDLSDQFAYVWNADAAQELFSFIATFTQAFVVVGIVAADGSGTDYIRHSDDVSPAALALR